ncbi:HNH endonuclease signature motif containing protein [Isoptericola chiayiensis]|nr:HNH endonuclease signature motif containing protein [Isoptericola chiayiensis]NOW02226.1 transcription elongation factor Elf1 [Isoptericola chiayiensis]
MAAGKDRGHAGNTGYDDQIDAYYSWDSKVPNHTAIQRGDVVALWDKKSLLGVSVVEVIQQSAGFKTQFRCVECNATRIHARKNASPRYRCSKCRAEFERPVASNVPVTQYTARHDAAWTPLEGLLDAEELRSLTVHQGDINAMRPLDWAAFRAALTAKGAGLALERLGARTPDLVWDRDTTLAVDFAHGFLHTMVRVRRGQRQFRRHLLSDHGNLCAFTGAAPERVLEAGHLYSYARLGSHHAHGGLMLRRDIHRLFDDGLLAVDPSRLRVDVAADLETYPQYARLHDGELVVPLRDEQVDWLYKHWEEHRTEPAPRA